MSDMATTKSVAILGEVLADVFPDTQVIGGAPFNVARHLSAFNLKTLMISRMGRDALASQVFANMQHHGLPTEGMQVDAIHPTGTVVVKVSGTQHAFEILPEQAYDYMEATAAIPLLAQYRPDVLYFGSLALRHACSRGTIGACIEHFKNAPNEEAGDVFLDINLRAPWYDLATLDFALSNATILKLNNEELRVLNGMLNLGAESDSPSSVQQAQTIKDHYRLEQVIVTCGEQGAWMLDETNRLWESAPSRLNATEIVDTVGAGDAFSAVCILGRLHGWSHAVTLQRANAFAAAVCTIRGAVPSSTRFYDAWIQSWGLAN